MTLAPDDRGGARLGWPLLIASLGLTFVVMVLGPSAAEAPLPGSALLLRTTAKPPAGLVVTLMFVAVLAGAVAISLGLSGRWSPSPKRLLAVGLVATAAFAIAPPIGSADQLSYAAYGRMVVTGHDPWSTTPASLARTGDPVARAVEAPWQNTPSVYGPVAAGEQALAAKIGGTDVAAIVELLDVVGALAVCLAGLLLWRTTASAKRARATLLWTANPLLLIPTIAGGHVDALVAALAVVSISIALRTGSAKKSAFATLFAAGMIAGLAADVKLPALLVVAGIALAATKTPGTVEPSIRSVGPTRLGLAAAVALGAAVVVVPAYAAAGPGIFTQLHRAATLVSAATPWRVVVDLLQLGLARSTARSIIGVLVIVVFLAFAAALIRLNSRDETSDPWGPTALTATLLVAYVIVSAYALPWYDAAAFGALAMATSGISDRLIAIHATVLTLAYLPGRAAVKVTGADRIIPEVIRSGLSPTIIFLLITVTWVLAVSYHLSSPKRPPLGPVAKRRILPSATATQTARQERGTQPRS